MPRRHEATAAFEFQAHRAAVALVLQADGRPVGSDVDAIGAQHRVGEPAVVRPARIQAGVERIQLRVFAAAQVHLRVAVTAGDARAPVAQRHLRAQLQALVVALPFQFARTQCMRRDSTCPAVRRRSPGTTRRSRRVRSCVAVRWVDTDCTPWRHRSRTPAGTAPARYAASARSVSSVQLSMPS